VGTEASKGRLRLARRASAAGHNGCSADLGNNESFKPYTRNLFVRRVLPKNVVSPNGLAAISKGVGRELGSDHCLQDLLRDLAGPFLGTEVSTGDFGFSWPLWRAS
jgi:hypothetical protein